MDKKAGPEVRDTETNVLGGGGTSKRDWIDYVIEHALHAYQGRKIVLWGYFETSITIQTRLREEHGQEIAFFVDSSCAKQDGDLVRSPACLEEMAQDFFVAVPLAFYPSIKNTLIQYGYQDGQDYIYFKDYQSVAAVAQRDDYYEDVRGNRIIGAYAGLDVMFCGIGATVQIGSGTKFQNVKMELNSYAEVNIGERCVFSSGVLYASVNGKIEIGADGYFSQGFDISAGENGLLQIGSRFTVITNFFVRVPSSQSPLSSRIQIGDDCLFSSFVMLMSADQHSIFDVTTGENINSSYPVYQKRAKILIGGHVWLGLRTTILYDTEIGDGSIAGACSLLKGKFPNNCVIAGVPAKIIRRNVAWSSNNFSESILDCGEEYIRMTQESDFE